MNVFRQLLEGSNASLDSSFESAVHEKTISFSKLTSLAQKGEIPLALFFANPDFVENQVTIQNEKILAGLSKESFSIGSRRAFDFRTVILIVKDLLRKQETLKRLDQSLTNNRIVGIIRRRGNSAEEDAAKLRNSIDLTSKELMDASSKGTALNLLMGKLESKQIFVSEASHPYMPQTLYKAQFSGLVIKDRKIPYIFITRGETESLEEPAGRTIFTLALLLTLIGRSKFSPVQYDTYHPNSAKEYEYAVASSFLMPSDLFRTMPIQDIEDIRSIADSFKVTPSAAVVRARSLDVISSETSRKMLEHLLEEFRAREAKSNYGRHARPEVGIKRYAGQEYLSRMFNAMDTGKILESEFRRIACLNKLGSSDLYKLRDLL